MNTRNAVVAVVLSGALAVTGAAYAQAPKAEPCPKAAERVEGQVVKVDPAQNKVTVRGADGTTHEFQTSKETLQDIKVGETLKAKLRVPENCKKS
jgi:hypothetical protein